MQSTVQTARMKSGMKQQRQKDPLCQYQMAKDQWTLTKLLHHLCGNSSMGLSRCQKGGSVIGFVLQPHGVNDPDPEVGQGPYRHTMAFPFRPLALIELPSPGLLPSGLPGELVEGIAPGLHASIPLVGLAVAATLVSHRRGACQGLDAASPSVSFPVITPFRQEPGRQPFPRSWQATDRRANCPTSTSINRLLVRLVTGSACNWGWCT